MFFESPDPVEVAGSSAAVGVRSSAYWSGLLAVCGLMFVCAPAPEAFEISLRTYPADSQSGGVLVYRSGGVPSAKALGPLGTPSAIHIIRREPTADGERITFRSTHRAGRVQFRGRASGTRVELTFLSPDSDSDRDGLPDAAELVTEQDRAAFRAWFVRIAESQFMRPSHAWQDEQRDCSGLIRFAYREALKAHDTDWQRRMGLLLDKNLPDVRRFHYPEVPVLGTRLFRVKRGPAPDAFAPFASAEYLMKFNARRIGDDPAAGRPGDLLFFRDIERPEGQGDFHSMILTEPARRLADSIVIYHTGGPNGLKRVSARYLLELPDRRFQPVPENPYFLGVFRFLLLD